MAGLLDAFLAGGNAGRATLENRRADADQSALRGLAPQIIAGNPQAYDQAAAISPQAAQAYQGAGDAQLRRLKGAIAFIDSQTSPEAKEGAYREVRPFLSRFGQEAPATFAEAMPKFEEAKARIAMLDSSPTQGRVQSTYVDASGNRVAVMADGTVQTLGQNAPNNQIIDTGNGFVGVNKGNLTAAPVMLGGQQAVPQATGTPTLEPGQGQQQIERIAQRANEMIAQGIPEAQVEAWAASQMGGGQVSEGLAPAVSAPPAQQLRSVQEGPSQIEMERLRLQQNADRRAEEAAQRSSVRQPTAAERRDASARKTKYAQAQNVDRGLERVQRALQAVSSGSINTGPLDQYAQRYTKAGQELEAAVGGMQNSLLALTRVPGIGAQSDLEARIAMLQYPSLDKAPEVNARTVANLREFARDLKAAYDTAIAEDEQMDTAPANAPRQSSDIDSLLDKYR